MPAPRKYDQETRERAVRMYQDRPREEPGESVAEARRRVGGLLDMAPNTLGGWTERGEIDAGQRLGVSSESAARIKQLEREVAELRRANEILEDGVRVFRRGGTRPQTSLIDAPMSSEIKEFSSFGQVRAGV